MKAVFDVHPLVNELICFEDGTCFFINQVGKCAANNYALKTGLKSEIVKREEEVKPKTTKKIK